MFQPLDAATFAKALASDEGLRPPIIVHGLVRKTADAKVIEFTLDVITCHLWLKIPLDLIERVVVLGKRTCHDHTHDFVAIQFKSPTNAEAQVFAALLQGQGTPGSSPMSPLDAGPLPTAALDAMHLSAATWAATNWALLVRHPRYTGGRWVTVGKYQYLWQAQIPARQYQTMGYQTYISPIV